jgi:GNAT superfamily N-acetyltransferase
MNIRKAKTKEDLDALGQMAYSFTKESKHVKVNPDRPRESYWRMIESGAAVVFMLEDGNRLIGGLGAIKYPDLHSGELFAVETFWYVLPEHRGWGLKLLMAYEQWAVDNECVCCAMIHMIDSMPESLEKLYRRKGYELMEKHYVRRIV